MKQIEYSLRYIALVIINILELVYTTNIKQKKSK